jgi:hypothetical protein
MFCKFEARSTKSLAQTWLKRFKFEWVSIYFDVTVAARGYSFTTVKCDGISTESIK